MAELGVGYISIVPEVSKISPGIAKALKGAEPQTEAAGQSMGSRLSSGMGKALKVSAAGVGVAAGAAIGTGLTKGLGRLNGIEQAEAKLRGLGHSTKTVETVMTNALASVKGTSFGLEDAATVAAGAVAANIAPGKELERTLKLVADSSTIAGRDIGEMGAIFNKVASSDMMQMDVANQLLDAGIPIMQMVSKEMGVTTEEARKLASEGKISFEIFQNAMEKGMGGAALESGNTAQGAFRNTLAALGRLGATIEGPFFRQATKGFGGMIDLVDKMDAAAKPAMATFESWLGGTAIPRLLEFGTAAKTSFDQFRNSATVQSLVERTGVVVRDLADAGMQLVPAFVSAGSALAKASSALGVGGWQIFLTTLSGVSAVAKAITPPLEMVGNLMEAHPGLVVAAVAAWAGFRTLPGIADNISSRFQGLNDRVGSLRDGFSTVGPAVQKLTKWSKESGAEMSRMDIYMQALGDTGTGMGQKLAQAYNGASAPLKQFAQAQRDAGHDSMTAAMLSGNAWDSADKQISAAGYRVSASIASMAGTVRGVGASAFVGMKSAVGGVVDILGGPWNIALMAAGIAIQQLSAANQRQKAANEAMTEATRDSAQAYQELNTAVVGTTGVLSEEGLAAAARVAKNELAGFVEQGEALSGFLYKVPNDASWWQRMLGTEEWTSAKEAAREHRAAYKELESATEELGIPMSELNNIVAEGGSEYMALVGSLRSTGGEANIAADNLEKARHQIDQAVNDARRLTPEVAATAEAMGVLADSSSTADEKLGALRKMLQAMGLAPKDAELAMRDAAAAVDEIVEKATNTEVPLDQMGKGLLDAAEAGDYAHKGWYNLSGTLMEMGEELANVASQGGDVEGVYAQQQEALDALADQYGITGEEIRGLAEKMGLVPNEIQVAMKMEGATEAEQQIANVWAGLKDLPPNTPVEVQVDSHEAREELVLMGYSVNAIPGSKNVSVQAKTEQAKKDLDTIFRRLKETGDLSVSPTILLNTTPLEGSAKHADDILAALDIQEPTPEAQIIIDELLSGVDISQGELDFLASQTPTPIADLDKALLQNNVSLSQGMLDTLNRQRPKPVLDADGRPLYAAVDSSKAKLNELQDKTVDIRIREWREYYSTGSNTSSGGTSVGQHYGATGGKYTNRGFDRLPAYAAGDRHPGYRLPKSGPGTNQVDGFVAYSNLGQPTARLDAGEWVINGRSSEIYNEEIKAINEGTFPKLPGYANGGRTTPDKLLAFARGQSVDGQRAARSLEGAPYVWGGINWGDCSGAMAGLARFAVGVSAFAGRFATMNQRSALAALGFSPGLGGPNDFSIGWYNGGPYGGHTSGTIAGTNVEMGGGRGNGQIGGRAAPASHSQYTDHAHISLTPPKPVKVGESYTEWRTPDGARSASNQGPGLQWSDSTVGPAQEAPGQSAQVDAIYKTAENAKNDRQSDAPTSWSEVAGIAASEFATGQVQDILDVFGIPDSPPFLQAYAKFVDDNSTDGENDWRRQDTTPQAMAMVFGQAMEAVVGRGVRTQQVPDAVKDIMTEIFGPIPGFFQGGSVSGTPGTDRILARLTDGEFVMNASDAERTRPLLEHLNQGGDIPTAGTTGNNYHIYGVDANDVVRQIEARDLAASMQYLGG